MKMNIRLCAYTIDASNAMLDFASDTEGVDIKHAEIEEGVDVSPVATPKENLKPKKKPGSKPGSKKDSVVGADWVEKTGDWSVNPYRDPRSNVYHIGSLIMKLTGKILVSELLRLIDDNTPCSVDAGRKAIQGLYHRAKHPDATTATAGLKKVSPP